MRTWLFTLLFPFFACVAHGDVAVLTQHNDNYRTGANLGESILNRSNVNAQQFGLLFTRPVDDLEYAQPLVMTNVNLGVNGVHNIVIVATVNDSVYAFDADDPSVDAPYWQVSFLGPNIVPPNARDFVSGDGLCPFFTASGNVGIIGTPVIDPTSGTLYLVARTKEISATATNFVQKLHALDLSTGAERSNSPVIITATVPAINIYDATNGIVTFDPFTANQRSGLALVNGIVYICWASECDFFKYHGWIMGYDATSLQQVSVYNDTPTGSQGGIWMGAAAPAADEEGNLYVSTGNGSVGDSSSPTNLINRGESFIKLSPNGTNLTVASWFTPFNWSNLDNGDLDLGSAGMLLIPGTHLAFSGGKQGTVYLVNRDNMGGMSLTSADTNVMQTFAVQFSKGLFGAPVWWDGPNGSYLYIWPVGTRPQQYKFDWTNQVLFLPAYSSGIAGSSTPPGGVLSLSANGTNAGTGVLWATIAVPDYNLPGGLLAFDAQNVTNLLWNVGPVGGYSKYASPTVANGKVYVARSSGILDVYGLLPPTLSVSLTNSEVVVSWPTNNYPSYTLQFSPSLAPGSWTNVTSSVSSINGEFEAAIPISGTSEFYRLKL